MKCIHWIPLFGAICLLTTVSADAKDKGKGHSKHEKEVVSTKTVEKPVDIKLVANKESSKAPIEVKITSTERETIRTYVTEQSNPGKGKKANGLPPGLQKKVERGGSLPPGWEKKVTVGQVMPVEVFKECKPLPKDLSIKLPSPPHGVITVAVDGRIVRLMEATREILDVFDVLPK